MNKFRLVMIVVVCLAAVAPARANLLENGGFEESTPSGSGPWGVGQDGINDDIISPWETDDNVAAHRWEIQLHKFAGATIGDYAVVNHWIRNWIYQDFDVTGGEKYALGNQFLSASVDVGYMVGRDMVILVQWYDPCDVQIITTDVWFDLTGEGTNQQDMQAIEVDRFEGGTEGAPIDSQDVWVSKGGVVQAPATAVKDRYIVIMQLPYYPETGWSTAHIDEAYVVSGKQARGPNPADGAIVATSTDELSWIQPEPADPGDTVICSVRFGPTDGDPNTLIASGDIDSVTLSTVSTPEFPSGITLEDDKEYQWTVDCNDTGTFITTEGPRWWTFGTGNAPPEVTPGTSYIWLTMDDGDTDANNVVFELTADVTDDGKPSGILYYKWELTEVDSPIPTIEWLDPNTAQTPRVKFFATGSWKFKLTVDDTNLTGSDEVNVNIYDSACAAAMGDTTDTPLKGDINEDCETNILDVVLVAESWLQCMSDKLVGIRPECTP